jgi:4a-hydroxytetrahydrobiopterin dehydratase
MQSMREFSLQNYTFEKLKNKKCYAFPESEKPMTQEQIDNIMKFIFMGHENKMHRWKITAIGENTMLNGRFLFQTYEECFVFVSALYRLGVEQSYYPDITFGDGFVYVSLYTIKLHGLHENDFIMMAKIEEMME